MALITDPDNLNQGTEIVIDEGARTIRLLIAGNLSADGVTHQCVYSFTKEEWKSDADLIKYPFPLISVTSEQFEWIEGWEPYDDATRKLLRTGGWRELDANDVNKREFTGVVSLGEFEDDVNDIAYYRKGDNPTLNDTVAFTYAGPVNEAIKIFEEIGNPPTCTFATTTTITRASGSFITDGYVIGGQVVIRNSDTSANDGSWKLANVEALTLTITGGVFTASGADTNVQLGWSIRNETSCYLRIRDADPEGKSFKKSDFVDIGVTLLTNKVERWGLDNKTDLKIEETDANIAANSPYTQINIKYFDAIFSMDIDLVDTERNFGICIDVGTHSGVDGSTGAAGSVLTSADGSIHISNYNGGTLTIHEGTNKGDYTIVSTTATTVTISGTFTNALSDQSFTCQRSSAIVASKEEIYEKVQWSLRQITDINYLAGGDDIIGKVADELLEFVGDTLKTGTSTPANPNGGGSGVVILGFDANDTNDLVFTDNVPTERTFPFVAAGTLNFSNTLVNDSAAEYFMFFEYVTRNNVADLSMTAASGATGTLTGAATLPTVANLDYINVQGFTNEENNGVYQVTDVAPTTSAIDVTKVDGDTLVNEGPVAGTIDDNPIDSPDALLVDNNAGNDITGNVSAAQINFDFDYDGNVQGGRSSSTDAVVIIRSIGLETAQFIEASGTITRNTGLSFTLTASLERNYENV